MKSGEFAQIIELLNKFQAEIFEILKSAKRIDEMNLKAKLWEIFNSLSNSLWSNYFKNKPEDTCLYQENKHLKSTLDRMEEQMLRMKNQMQEKELSANFQSEYMAVKLELKKIKDFSRELQSELNQKISIIQNQEQQLGLLRHELRNKDFEPEKRPNPRNSDENRESLLKVIQERDSLREWKNQFTQYPSTYEKAIQRIKEEHLQEKMRLQENIEQLRSLIGDASPTAAKTSIGFFPQSSGKEFNRGKDVNSRSLFEENKLKETISILYNQFLILIVNNFESF